MKTAALGILLLVIGAPVSAQWLDHPTSGIPRNADGTPNLTAPAPLGPDGKPDLSGLWTRTSTQVSTAFTPVDSSSVDAVVRQRAENFGQESMKATCLPEGPAYLYARGPDLNWAMYKLIQTPSLIVILHPDLTYRQIYMDGRTLEADANPNWMGYSVGRWEGDTLVVESAGFNDRTWLDGGYPHSEKLHAIERYRRTDFGHITVDVELRDPQLYTKPWKATIEAQLAADTELLEYVCNGEKAFHEHWVGTRSDAARTEIAIAAEALAKYAGTYTERRPFWQDAEVARVFEISFADGALFLGPTRLSPQSETVFVNSGLAIEFVRNAAGVPTHLFDKHVSGDYRFDRTR
jgi:hypothetical protein